MIGLHGRLGSGKDTVLERLQLISPGKFERVSFADPLKRSAAALLGVGIDQLEKWKRDELAYIEAGAGERRGIGYGVTLTMREFLQRYGTEAHREIFGNDFWVEQGMRRAREITANVQLTEGNQFFSPVPVFTDVRFKNEAEAILDRGGEIWHVQGPDEDTGAHASETPLPVPMIDRYIDNTARDDAFAGLDAQLRQILNQHGIGSPHETNPDRPHSNDRAAGNHAGS